MFGVREKDKVTAWSLMLLAKVPATRGIMDDIAANPRVDVNTLAEYAAARGEPASVLVERAREKLGLIEDEDVAVVGVRGAGASTLINAVFQGNSAQTHVCLRTSTLLRHSSAMFPTLKLWDTPAFGNHISTVKGYMLECRLYAFRRVVLVYAGRLPDYALALVENLQSHGAQVCLVRNKADADLEETTVEELRKQVQRSAPITTFCVSAINFNQAQVDEPALIAWLLQPSPRA